MPTLYVLGGANGVGKTTLYHAGIGQFEVDPKTPFINVDTIALRELGDYSPASLARAEELARERMKLLIQEKKDLIIESNLSKSSDYDWIALMRKNGYDTVLFFMSTDSVKINIERVHRRAEQGGHDIPEPIIEQRYRMGLTYLKSNLLLFSKATLFDASKGRLQKIAYLEKGQIFYKDADCPDWTKKCLEIAERLQEKAKASQAQSLSLDSTEQQTAPSEKQGHAHQRRKRRPD
jgi:predicted ABC-type ATPase